MFAEAVADLEKMISENGRVEAKIFSGGFATSMNVIYLPNQELLIEGSEECPYILISGKEIYLDMDKEIPAVDHRFAWILEQYKIHDPRAILPFVTSEEADPTTSVRRYVTFDFDKLFPSNPYAKQALGQVPARITADILSGGFLKFSYPEAVMTQFAHRL